MIKFTTVQGVVLVKDMVRKEEKQAEVGSELNPQGTYCVVTTPESRAVIQVNGQFIEIKPNSLLNYRGGRSWIQGLKERWGGNIKMFVGKIWAKLDQGEYKEEGGGGGGIRG